MAVISWAETGMKKFESGVSKGVLYPKNTEGKYTNGVAWVGLTSISESPDGADANDLWADNTKYASLRATETFGGTIEAYTYPPEFEACDGSATLVKGITIGQQDRQGFGLSYVTRVGSDADVASTGYKIHLVYGCTASPSDRQYETVNDSPDAIQFSWEFDTVPVAVDGHKPTATMIIDSTAVSAEALAKIEAKLYGTPTTTPELPLPDEIMEIIEEET